MGEGITPHKGVGSGAMEVEFNELFVKTTGHEGPFNYQRRLALDGELPQLLDVPTGAGKTAGVVLAWLWRRRFASEEIRKATPRRLVYCLPMRVLVEQTRDNVVNWLHRLGCLGGAAHVQTKDGKEVVVDYEPNWEHPDKITVTVLMGGEDADEWDLYPERDAVIIGTQDMLLSRALNRGYASGRSRWPMQFGLLHTGCLWVFDEIQLMGAGLATTAQMEAFRRLLPNNDAEAAKTGHGCRSIWMSATMQKDWLDTVDFKPYLSGLTKRELTDTDYENEQLKMRWEATKPLTKAVASMGDAKGIAEEVRKAHKPGTRTIVVVNTVRRARELFDVLSPKKDKKARDSEEGAHATPSVVLLHSRFRPGDREKAMGRALAEPPPEGTIIVSTQVIEAGVDVSATTMFTELAPWASLVQRFGRCNRKAKENENAAIRWIDLPDESEKHLQSLALPYDNDDLTTSTKHLVKLKDVGLKSLPKVQLPFEHTHVIRRRDLIDLFDTTPDLAGSDIDIDRFVREVEESDVRVFWRDYGETPNATDDKENEPAPKREELCPAPIGDFKKFATNQKRKGKVWRWDFLERKWEKVTDANKIAPGHVFLVHTNGGGYSTKRGWDPAKKKVVGEVQQPEGRESDTPEANDDDRLSCIGVWQTIAEHTNEVCTELDAVLDALPSLNGEANALRSAARWHDRGKAHKVFQDGMPEDRPKPGELYAKANGCWDRYERPHFRHELASSLTVLDPRNDEIPNESRNLVAYLVAAHHGKVRLSIRSLPNEKHPDGGRRFARGVWDDDELPETDLGDGVMTTTVKLSLEPMELGLCENEPFVNQPSWAERMIRLRDTLGPFRLAYLETLLRAADQRASKKTKDEGV